MAQAIPDISADKPTLKEQAADKPVIQGPLQVRSDDNVVFVGKKPTMSYVLAVMTQIQSGAPDLHIKARGRSVSRAVDVAEVVRNRFLQDLKREISIGTEVIQDKENNKLNVSTIDIKIIK